MSEKIDDLDDSKRDIESQQQAQGVNQDSASEDIHDRELSAGVAKVEAWIAHFCGFDPMIESVSMLGRSSCLG